jgi:hypothetical protein
VRADAKNGASSLSLVEEAPFNPKAYSPTRRLRWRYERRTKTITVSPELADQLERAGLVRRREA